MKPDKTVSVADQVVDWLLLLRSGQATPRDHAAFMAWRAANPMHESAWQQLTGALGSTFGRLSDAYPVGYIAPASAKPRARPAPAVPGRRRLLTGSLALAGSAVMASYIGDAFYPLRNLGADAGTATGERKDYILSDGTRLLLDARSRVQLHFSATERRVHLLEGALMVGVAHDANRPFVVQTAEGTVRALGTRYMVRQQTQRSLVIVHENSVHIETLHGSQAEIAEGHGARFDTARIDTPRAPLMADAAWETGWIDVRGRPLAEVITALRPYRPGVLRISMAAGGLLVSGRYPLDDTDATLDALEASMPIAVRRYTPWMVSINLSSSQAA